MATTDVGWTGKWVAEAMGKVSVIVSARLQSPQLVELQRLNGPPALVATTAAARVSKEVIGPLFDLAEELAFVVNVPKESYVAGDALALAKARGVPIGGLKDLMSAVRLQDISSYENQEFQFVERGLKQHTRVERFKRLDDRRYLINRRGLDPVRVVFLNEYELTADHVRIAAERYEFFEFLVVTNPNGTATTSAECAANSIGCQICNWGSFLGVLNKK